MRLRVATYNIHRCIGRDGVEAPERIAQVLRAIDADVVALQEVACVPGTPTDVLALLSRAAKAAAIQGFTLIEARKSYGSAVLTRLAPASIRRHAIDVPNREPRGLLEIRMNFGQRSATVLATHLGLGIRERRHQLSRLLAHLDTIATEVVILLGDFNEWFPYGRTQGRLRRRFSPMPSPSTFPAHRPLLALDRIWVRPPEALRTLTVPDTPLTRSASDHLPLVAELDLPTVQCRPPCLGLEDRMPAEKIR